jgi:hypothetical protein
VTSREPWRALGVEPTTDQGAIRRAYADRLRALDVDADPAGFARLRDAREAALAWAREPAADDDGKWSDEEDGYRAVFSERELFDILGAPSGASRDVPPPADASPCAEVVPADAPAVRASPWEVPAIDYDAHYQAVLDLLLDGEDDPLAPERAVELGSHVDTLLLDPRLDGIDYRDRAERWFADVMADAGERADPVVERVVARFGWDADRGRIDQPWAMDRAAARAEAVRFLRRVTEPDHPYHGAWRELTRPDGVRRPWRLDRAKVRTLLQAIRVEHPEIEERLVPARVKQWEPGRARRLFGSINLGGYLTWAALAFVIFLVRACPVDDRRGAELSPPDSFAKLADFPSAAAPMLATIGGEPLTPELVEARNSELFGAIRSEWDRAKRSYWTQYQHEQRLRLLLTARLNGATRRADYDLIARLRRNDLAMARLARKQGDGLCNLYWKGRGEVSLTDEEGLLLRGERVALQRELLLSYGAPSDPAGSRLVVPGPVMNQVARRAGLERARLGEALRDGGAPAARCAARIALVETALELPRDEGLRLLRDL